MTALDIIKMLPIEDKLKSQLVSKYPHLKPAEKLDFDRLAWTTYDSMREEELTENLGIQYAKVTNGEDKFGKDFYSRALKKTDEELGKEFQESGSSFDLAEARKAMEIIVREIQASKKK